MGIGVKLGPKGVIVLAIVLIGLLVFVSWVALAYNSLVRRDTAVLAQWAQVENQYQRKIDLIPRLINITSQYTQFERSVLENITRLRTQWMNSSGLGARINNSIILDQQIFLLIATYENYPSLRSIDLVYDVMTELTGTENQIAVERMRFNEAVRVYNTQVRSFPDTLIAGSFGFQVRPFYDPIPGGP
jgi:LemA protein